MSIKEKLEWFRNELKMLNKKEKIVIILLFISFAGFIITGPLIEDDVKELLIRSLFIFFGGFVFYLFPDTTSILFMKDESDKIFTEDRLNKKDVNKFFKGAGIIAMFCQVPVITLILFSYDVPFVLGCISLLFIVYIIVFFKIAFDSDFSELLKYVSANELTLIYIMAIVVSTALTWMILIIFDLPANLPAGFIGIEIIFFIIILGLLAMPAFLLGVGLRQLLKLRGIELRKKRRGEQ